MTNDDKREKLQQMRQLVASNSWIKTPFAYTKLSNKASLIQQNALLMVSDHIQTYIKDFYNLHLDKSKKRPKSLFTEHLLKNGIPSFRIYLADLGVQPNNYRVVRDAIEEMNVLVEHPVIDENGIPTGETAFTPVFEEFRVKETGDFYKYKTEGDDGLEETAISARHYGYIDVTINHRVAEWAFDMSQGYVNHYKMIARYSTKRTTPRLYLLLMREVGKGKMTARLTVGEVKEYLGIVPYKDEKTGEMVTPYPKFAHFRSKVLDAVKDDLDRMAQEDHTDIKFDYKLVYPGERKRGEPEYIDFIIMRTVLGDAYNVVVNHKKSELLTATPVQQEIFTDAYEDTFNRCIDDFCSKIQDEDKKVRLKRVSFISFNNESGELMVMLPNHELMQWLESDLVLPHWWAYLRKHFGKQVKLNYKIKE